MPDCPNWLGDVAVGMVDSAYTTYTGFAMQSFTAAMDALSALEQFTVKPINFSVSYNIDEKLYGIERPEAPKDPKIKFLSPQEPPEPPRFSLSDITFDTPPSFNEAPPVLTLPPPPGETLPAPPGAAPALVPLTIPAAPTLDFPAIPELIDIVIPSAPSIMLPTFSGVRPSGDIPIPVENFAFTPEQYTSALLDKVTGRVSAMLEGGTGLPAAVAQALRDRAYVAVDAEEARAVQTARDEFASMGWDEPNGMLAARLLQVRQNSQSQRSALSRDIYIRDEEIAIENLRFAVTNGISLESQLISAHNAHMQLSLQAEQFAVDVSIRIFDGRVALFNAQMQAYQVDAQVYRDLIQAELAKLEIFKAQIDAERLKGEINQQAVAIYEQRVRALLAHVEIYKAQIDAVRAQGEANAQQIEAYRTTVQAYAERVRAHTAIWDGYRSRVDAELAKGRVYETLTNAYATRVRAWSDVQTSRAQQQTAQVRMRELELQGWRGQVDTFVALVGAERERVTTELGIFNGLIERFRAQTALEVAAGDAAGRQFQLSMEQERARVDTSLKQAELDIQQLVQLVGLALEKLKTIATVSSQLAASSMSAVNFSAGVSSGRNQSQSCNTNFTYSGELDA